MERANIEQVYEIYLNHPTLSKDTRTISKGCIYLALKGTSFNGNAFADEALSKGASYVIIDEE